ncbi:MAG: hypothetical protein ACYDDU_05185 [Dermatophilaceae bacterium]
MTTFTMRRPRITSGIAVGFVAIMMGLFIGALVPNESFVRLAIAASVAVLLIAVGLRSPRLLLFALLVWLPAFGMLRRLVTTLGAAGPLGDPLLLVAPAAWVLLAAAAVSRGALRQRTALATTVLVLTGLLTISAVNPLQGGLTVGLGGLLLVVPPMLAFWVGRSLVDDRVLRRVIALVAWLALPAAAYGLIQTFAGFPSWDARWIVEDGYTALNVGGVIRAFGSFASGAEYASYLAVGFVAWLALGRGPLRLPLTMGALALLGTALWLESSRGIIVLTSVAVVLLLLARRGVPLRWALFGAVALLAALPWLVSHVAPTQSSGDTTGGLVAHQVQGLTDPFGQESTLPTHIAMVTNGLQQAIANPLGKGVGTVTSAAGKYGGVVGGTEADPGNVAVAAGALGLVTYVLLVLRGLPLAYRVAARRRDGVALAALAILAVTFLQWLNGAQYAVAPLPWLMLGWLDRHAARGVSASSSEDSE